jgi:flagellar biosynthesis protein FliQ
MKKRQKKGSFFNLNFFKKNIKGIIMDYLPWIILAVLVLVIVFMAIFVIKDTGIGFLDKILGLFRRR